jgi:hypothetical protein
MGAETLPHRQAATKRDAPPPVPDFATVPEGAEPG